MRPVLAVACVALVLVPSAGPMGVTDGEVVYATWLVGGRFTREEWLERSSGATHRIDTGGPACPRTTVANRRAVAIATCNGDRVWFLHRIRRPGDRLLLESSDLLRPRRLLKLGKAEIIGRSRVDGRPALRLRLPSPSLTVHADIDRRTSLPLRFTSFHHGDLVAVEKPHYRSIRRSSLPRDFFTPG